MWVIERKTLFRFTSTTSRRWQIAPQARCGPFTGSLHGLPSWAKGYLSGEREACDLLLLDAALPLSLSLWIHACSAVVCTLHRYSNARMHAHTHNFACPRT